MMTDQMISRKKTCFSVRLKRIHFIKVIVVLFLIGMVYGALLVGLGQAQTQEQLSFLTEQFIGKRAEQSIMYTFIGSFNSSAVLLLALFVLGFCAVGQPVALFLPVFHGLGLGISMAYLYSTQGFQGILFTLILILPSAAISTIALFLGTRESVRFSNSIFRMLFPEKYEVPQQSGLKLYLIRFGVLLLFDVAAAMVDSVCTFLFAGFFVV